MYFILVHGQQQMNTYRVHDIFSVCAIIMGVCIAIDYTYSSQKCVATSIPACGTAIFAMEMSSYTLDKKYRELVKSFDKAYILADNIHKDFEDMDDYLTKEHKLVGRLDASLNCVRQNLKLSEAIFTDDIPYLRELYIDSLDDLGLKAREYLDQANLKQRYNTS